MQGFRRLLLEGRLLITVEGIRLEIGERGYGVACHCREDQDCHGDVNLDMAYS